MVHVIPLSVGQRRRDAGNPVQGADSPPLGEAVQPLDDDWQALAGHYQLRQAQQQAFDTEIAARRLNGQLAQAEADAVANAAADGAGLHDAMYGQVNPRTGQVVKTGLFDTLFDGFVKQAPAELRPGLASRKPALREAGSIRMALQQNQRRRDYEQAEVDTALKTGAIAIGNADPDDHLAFEAARQEGLDLIDRMGVDPGIRQQMAKDWYGTAAKARFEALIARDPQRALDMLTTGATTQAASNDAAGDETMGWMLAPSSLKAAKGDRVGKLTPDERVAQAFGDTAPPDPAIPLEAITYLKPADLAALTNKANNASAAQTIGAHARVMLAEQNAPAVIAATGKYPEEEPTAQDFVNIYGAEEGPKHLDQFRVTTAVAKAFSDMYRAPNRSIHAELRDLEPGPDGSPEERERYEIKSGAAQLVLAARDADPVAYVNDLFRDSAPDWGKVETPQEFQSAVAWVRSAQAQMGFSKVLSVPQDVADGLGARYVDESVPLQQRIIELSEKLKAVRDPEARFIVVGQVFPSALAGLRRNAAGNPNITPAELEAQEQALEANLIEMAAHPARVRFHAGLWWQKPLAATNDTFRLIANGATFSQADRLTAGVNSLFSDKSYDELLAAEQAETEDAQDRAGSAGEAANLLGAFATGHGLQRAGLTFTGRFAAEGLKGLPGFFARSATAAADGAVFGGVDAALNGRDIVREMGTGALFGAGGNALAEGIGAAGRWAAAKIRGHFKNAKTPAKIEPAVSDQPAAADHQTPAAGAATNEISTGQDIHVYHMRKWDASQREAATLKAQRLTDSDASVNHHVVRDSKSARRRYIEAGNKVAPSEDVDHIQDLQLNGSEEISNLDRLDRSVNRSFGAQIKNSVKSLPHGTKINRVTIGDR
ncbi:hypothetical protein [Mesorhizobium comanense]|uniref:hypothetical protein n=1 Tax=Mesorhizobium comanense TaxID=2502215 RepID=UPI0010F7F314|nr:hypothetical protein [Mesorhizobium comanense]